ncbi:hypothetical protein [Hydrocarboniclastica marina]|uniref:Uncharacterized protein n=1 Tax=Hydrocarboniclastica marina TaxID=2259620 RepID=A0A4P7XMZ0_9ALTE|nr:hypothetical protein [Hydrocarboniclastica marina]QCF28052.1 hypothetical protein soil367_18435 [Hydrocarboniclastica marina]
MNFQSWKEGVTQLSSHEAFVFVRDNDLQSQFPEISDDFQGTLAIYPGGLVITQVNGLYRLVLGDYERSNQCLAVLEKSLFRWAWDNDRLAS